MKKYKFFWGDGNRIDNNWSEMCLGSTLIPCLSLVISAVGHSLLKNTTFLSPDGYILKDFYRECCYKGVNIFVNDVHHFGFAVIR